MTQYDDENRYRIMMGDIGIQARAATAIPMLHGESVDAYTVRYMAHTKEKNRAKAAASQRTYSYEEAQSLAERGLALIVGFDGRWRLVAGQSEPAEPAQAERRRNELNRLIRENAVDADQLGNVSEAMGPFDEGKYFADPPHACRPTQAERRREIDALLREDARTTPAFATARMAAALAAAECDNDFECNDVRWLLADLRRYEDARGSSRKPSAEAFKIALGWAEDAGGMAAFKSYERARGMR